MKIMCHMLYCAAFSYNTIEHITLPSFASICFLILIINAESIEDSCVSVDVNNGTTSFLYLYAIVFPLDMRILGVRNTYSQTC
jgi:hypothetical protein